MLIIVHCPCSCCCHDCYLGCALSCHCGLHHFCICHRHRRLCQCQQWGRLPPPSTSSPPLLSSTLVYCCRSCFCPPPMLFTVVYRHHRCRRCCCHRHPPSNSDCHCSRHRCPRHGPPVHQVPLPIAITVVDCYVVQLSLSRSTGQWWRLIRVWGIVKRRWKIECFSCHTKIQKLSSIWRPSYCSGRHCRAISLPQRAASPLWTGNW